MGSRIVGCAACGRRNRVPAAAKGTPRCANCHNPLPWIADADDRSFAEIVDRSELPVVVDLWATWCGPCRMVSPALEQVARDMAGQIKLVKIDIDASPALARRFEVQAVPTLLVMDHADVIARQAGAAPAPALRAWVQDALRGAGPAAGRSGQEPSSTTKEARS
ncbi:MAG TPA: thioredoxin [Streptosporangiaceae bacterium]|jgi:thioredoxin 2